MLVLSRKMNESIVIADNIELMVIEIKGDQVKLGIKAPKNIAIHRGEIYEEIKSQNIAAAKSPSVDVLKKIKIVRKKKD